MSMSNDVDETGAHLILTFSLISNDFCICIEARIIRIDLTTVPASARTECKAVTSSKSPTQSQTEIEKRLSHVAANLAINEANRKGI